MKENFLAALTRQSFSSDVIWPVTDNHLSVTSVIYLHQLCSSFNFTFNRKQNPSLSVYFELLDLERVPLAAVLLTI